MSAISRYEVRLKCVEAAISISSDQDPLDQILEQADRIYVWVNKVEKNGNRPNKRHNKGHYRNHDHQPRSNRGRFYDEGAGNSLPQSDLFD